MSHEKSCNEETCHHEHHHSAECSCCHEEICCHHNNNHHHHEHPDFAHQLLEMADEAWMEVLKEKIKANIETKNGKQLDELANLVTDGNNIRWKNKIESQTEMMNYKDKISNFFHKK